MYAGVVAPPLIIGAAVGLSPTELALLISASLFTAGLATLLQSLGLWRFGARLPFINGVSFAVVAPVLAIAKEHQRGDALPVIYGSIIVAGVLAVFLAPYFGKLTRFFPVTVSGVVITLIGLSLLPVAIKWIRGQDPHAVGYGSPRNVLLAVVTLVVVLVCNRFLTGVLNRLSLLIGLVVGTLAAWPLGVLDTSAITQAPVFSFVTPLHFGAPRFDVAALVSMCIVMVVAMTESTADMLALGEVVDRPVTETTIANGLRADGAASALSALFGGFTCTAFAQNIGLIALTRMFSRYVVAAAGVVLVLLGLFPVAGGVVALVPQPVLGGAGLVLFGSVAVSGIKALGVAGLGDPAKVMIVAVSLGVGLVPIAAPDFYQHFPAAVQTVFDSGISAGTVTAVLLNLVFGRRPVPVPA
ncbi:purine permease [Solihabitans fulvus]|uniref:Purine permease n=2 Tax=Solihabitans fulvus TaxID=1892852 RepID=A0A5B2WNS8_9PSEU|nr:purine permease [Solihabitans fulvus]